MLLIRSATLYGLSLCLIALLMMGISIQMGQALQFSMLEIALMGAIAIVAALLGLTAGMFTLAVLFFAWYGLSGAPVLPLDGATPELLLQLLFGCAVAATGLFSDYVRRRYRSDRALPGMVHGAAIGPQQGKGLQGHLHGFLEHLTGFWISHRLAANILSGAGVCAAGLLAAWWLRGALGSTTCVLIALSGVIAAASLTGPRIGALLATASALALVALSGVPGNAVWLTPINGLFAVVIFAGLGWAVGAFMESRRQAHRAVQVLMRAGREMSVCNEEVGIRCLLFDSLTALASGGMVELIREGVDAAGLPDAAGWQSCRLKGQGREVGTARWRFYGPDRQQIRADAAVALCDLAAANIVRVRLEQEKIGMAFEARTEHLRTILLDAVSHHFRSPLAGILGSVTSILTLPDPPDLRAQRELLLIIKEQANRLSRYVDNFLSVARLESGAIEVRPAEVDLEALIYDVWESFGEAGGARRFFKVTGVAGGLRTDPALLGQVLGNILENAIKYSEEESVVEVHIWRAEGRVMIQVTDQGPGIPPASQKRMFERFFRSPGARVPGLGLGLYITRSLVEILGGDVQASNRAHGGPGLAVTIALPGEGGVV